MDQVTAWKEVLQGLEVMLEEPSARGRNTAALTVIAVVMRQLGGGQAAHACTPAAAAIWRQLVLGLQVPLHVCSACTKLASQPRHQQQPLLPVTAALNALHQLLCAMHAAQQSAAAGLPASLMAAVRAQVEQSSLLQRYPALLTALAEDLQQQGTARTRAAAAAAAEPDHTCKPDATSSSATGSSGCSRLLRERAHSLLGLYAELIQLWPQGPERRAVGATSAPAVMHLVSALLQEVSSEVQQLQQPQLEGWPSLGQALRSGYGAAVQVCLLLDAGGEPEPEPCVQQVLLSPHFLPFMGVLWPMAALAMCIKDKDSGSDGRGSRKHAPRDSSKEQQQAQGEVPPAWQEASTLLSSVTPCQNKLFQLLGVDARTMLLAAVLAKTGCCAQIMNAISGCYRKSFMLHCTPGCARLGATRSAECVQQLQQLQLQQQLHLLLPTVLLSWPAALRPGEEHCSICVIAAHGSCLAIQAWKEGRRLVRRVPDDPWLQRHPPEPLLHELLPLLSRLVAQVLLHSSSDAMSSSDTPTLRLLVLEHSSSGAPGSSNASSPSPNRSGARHVAAGADHALTHLVDVLRVLLACSVSSSVNDYSARRTAVAEAAASTGGGFARRQLLRVPGLAQHTSAILGCVEGMLRHVASKAAPRLNVLQLGLVADLSRLIGERLLPLTLVAGLGSREQQQQLYSLVCSLLKVARRVEPDRGLGLCMTVAGQAAAVWARTATAGATLRPQSPAAPALAAASSGVSGSSSGSSSVAVVAESLPSSQQCAAASMLPGLSLFGRCCILWAWQLQQDVAALLRAAAAAQQTVQECVWDAWQLMEQEGTAETFGPVGAACVCFWTLDTSAAWLEGFCSTHMSWLQSDSVAAQLAAQGHDPQKLLHQLRQLCAAREAAASSTCATGAEAKMAALVQQLQDVGMACSSVAATVFCNNPHCDNITGDSEQRLVSGRSCQCGGCKVARYCGHRCQKAHWRKQHKPVCKALAAAAAATS